jgi:hypothetical protein
VEQLKWPKKHDKILVFIDKLQRYRGYFDSAKSSDTLALADNAVTLAKKSFAVETEVLDSTKLLQTNLDNVLKKEQWAKMLMWISNLDLDELKDHQNDLYSVRRGEPRERGF